MRWKVLLSTIALGLGGACLIEGVCYEDTDCEGDRICDRSLGLCVEPQPECRSDDDCGLGKHCDPDTQTCVDIACTRDEDCRSELLVCQDGRCVFAGPIECPEAMVAIDNRYCMDIYEASRPDATETDMGEDCSRAVSRQGVMPWWHNPMDSSVFDLFKQACRNAGKHLCTEQEWFTVCIGPEGHSYFFGDVFDVETCNCVDTFCDDYCIEHGIDLADCPLGANCGYTFESFHDVPCGTFPDCTNSYGVFDLAGNAWEIVETSAGGYQVRGGAFNCAGARERLKCTFNATWSALYAGFRCCWTPGVDPQP
ncbi:MAG: SUMF1/EgtB/PvdO family nonheme iron enzyme [Deltaproteobacteria bacterium]|nr:SUMF1/EgtB/PvdO family nonheme iron enzyme [Deltaproteobacteria bacterium]